MLMRKATALTLILALAFSAVAAAMLVKLGRANPYTLPRGMSGGHLPPEAVGAEPPYIEILSPQNNSVSNQVNVTLLLNVMVGNSSSRTGSG